MGLKAPLKRDQSASAPSSICLDFETDGVNLWTTLFLSGIALSLCPPGVGNHELLALLGRLGRGGVVRAPVSLGL